MKSMVTLVCLLGLGLLNGTAFGQGLGRGQHLGWVESQAHPTPGTSPAVIQADIAAGSSYVFIDDLTKKVVKANILPQAANPSPAGQHLQVLGYEVPVGGQTQFYVAMVVFDQKALEAKANAPAKARAEKEAQEKQAQEDEAAKKEAEKLAQAQLAAAQIDPCSLLTSGEISAALDGRGISEGYRSLNRNEPHTCVWDSKLQEFPYWVRVLALSASDFNDLKPKGEQSIIATTVKGIGDEAFYRTHLFGSLGAYYGLYILKGKSAFVVIIQGVPKPNQLPIQAAAAKAVGRKAVEKF